MEIEKDYFRPFITHPNGILRYIEEMRGDGKWGGDIEIQILSEIYDVKIEVYDHSPKPVKVFNEKASQTHKIVRLLYLQMSHYDSLHFLEEKATVLVGEFGTMEEIVLESARERVTRMKNLPKGMVIDRDQVDKASKKLTLIFLTEQNL